MPNYESPPSSLKPGSIVVAYLRDSGHENQELSVAQQEAAIRDWCAKHQLIVEHIYKDEARRGSTDADREALDEMMNTLRHNAKVAGVVVWSNSRFARNTVHAQFYRAEIRKLGYIFHSITDKITEGPESIIFEALIDYKNQQYLRDMSIDVKRGLRQLVEQFGCVPGVPPTGFKREQVIVGQHRDGKPRIAHRWIIDPLVAPRVLEAFEMRSRGASLAQINTVTKLFTSLNSYRTFWPNRIYIGILHFGDLVIEGYAPPIVPTHIFEGVQAIQKNYAGHHHVKAGSTLHPRRSGSAYLLSGIAHCARCGSPLFGRTSVQKSGRYLSYFCTRAYRNRDCTKQRIPGNTLENAVLEKITEVFLKEEYLKAVKAESEAGNAGLLEETKAEQAQVAKELAETRRQITNLSEAIADAGHTRALIQRLNLLEKTETEQLTRLEQLKTVMPHAAPDPEQLRSRIARMSKALTEKSTFDERLAILRGIVTRVDVDREENRLKIAMTVYYPPGEDEDPSEVSPPTGQSDGGRSKFMPKLRYPSGPLLQKPFPVNGNSVLAG